MSRFTEAIRLTLPSPCWGRPFVCDGDPDKCTVLVIGENPATEVGVDWWSYWSDRSGFNYAHWRSEYEARRVARGKPPVSPTRRRLDRLRQNGLLCLETNVFMNEQPTGHGLGQSNTDLLDIALSNLPNLAYVIAHGQEAHRYLTSRRIALPATNIFRTRHFRLESYATLDALTREILGR